jgi:hypothetical protein
LIGCCDIICLPSERTVHWCSVEVVVIATVLSVVGIVVIATVLSAVGIVVLATVLSEFAVLIAKN